MQNGRFISFTMFLILVVIVIALTCSSCTSIRMKKQVDYSYTQDHRDSVIARVHHYEVKHKAKQITEKQENRLGVIFFIFISLIIFLI